VLLVIAALALVTAAAVYLLQGRRAALRAGWLVLSFCTLTAAWQAGGAPLLAYMLMR
jgi:hypothetical protein